MKRNYIGNVSFASLMFAIATTGAFAQSSVKATVPFSFTAGRTQLPAGQYQIKEDHTMQQITVFNVETHATVISHVSQETPRGGARYKVVFHHFGDQYCLAAIRGGADGLDVTVPVTKQEKQLRSMQVASARPQNHGEIEIALK